MVTRKEDTPQRRANRKYEVKNKEKRKAKCGNFQSMIPRELFDEINAFLKENGIMTVFHYVPLHSSPAGLKFGRFHGEDRYTTKESERLLRLPLYYGLTEGQVNYITSKIKRFYGYE